MNKIAFISTLLLLIVASCKKEIVEETPSEENVSSGNNSTPNCTHIEPGNYFPAYPQSYWNYTQPNGNTVHYEISEDYESLKLQPLFPNPPIPSTDCYPFFLNMEKAVDGNKIIHEFYPGQGTVARVRSVIYSEDLDSTHTCALSFSNHNLHPFGPYDSPLFSYRRTAIHIDTSIMIGTQQYDNVIMMYETDTANVNHRYIDYFSKDVGLIKRDSINPDSSQIIPLLTLDNYHIEH